MSTLSNSISTTSEDIAIVIPSNKDTTTFQVTYKDIAEHTRLIQSQLAKIGLKHGDAVSIVIPNTYSFIISFLAVTSQRLLSAPLNSAYKEAELDFYLRDLNPALVVVAEGDFERNTPAVNVAQELGIAIAECFWNGHEVVLELKSSAGLAEREPQPLGTAEPDDVALVLHTSGTTGRPKAVPLSHRNLARTMRNITATYELSRDYRTLLVMPLFHVHGLFAGLLAPLHSGGSVVIPLAFHASTFWADFTKYEANWFTAVPTIHMILLRQARPSPMPKIRFIRSSSAALSPTTFHQLEKAFDAPVLESYGMTEATHQIASNPLPYKGKRQPGTVGLPQGDVQIKILDREGHELPHGSDGEICIRGENIMAGYISNPAANASSFSAEGFFRTGDQGRVDPNDKYLTITGRIKELINRAGEKISPTEIDQLLLTCPLVSEACSFAIPSEVYGEEVGVAVVLKEDAISTTTEDVEEEIIEYVKARVVRYKIPKRIWIVPTIPKTPTGKVQRLSVAKTMLAQDVELTKTSAKPTAHSIASGVKSDITTNGEAKKPASAPSTGKIKSTDGFPTQTSASASSSTASTSTAATAADKWSLQWIITGGITIVLAAIGFRYLSSRTASRGVGSLK